MNWDEIMETAQGHRYRPTDTAVTPTPISIHMRAHTAVTGQ